MTGRGRVGLRAAIRGRKKQQRDPVVVVFFSGSRRNAATQGEVTDDDGRAANQMTSRREKLRLCNARRVGFSGLACMVLAGENGRRACISSPASLATAGHHHHHPPQ